MGLGPSELKWTLNGKTNRLYQKLMVVIWSETLKNTLKNGILKFSEFWKSEIGPEQAEMDTAQGHQPALSENG